MDAPPDKQRFTLLPGGRTDEPPHRPWAARLARVPHSYWRAVRVDAKGLPAFEDMEPWMIALTVERAKDIDARIYLDNGALIYPDGRVFRWRAKLSEFELAFPISGERTAKNDAPPPATAAVPLPVSVVELPLIQVEGLPTFPVPAKMTRKTVAALARLAARKKARLLLNNGAIVMPDGSMRVGQRSVMPDSPFLPNEGPADEQYDDGEG